MQQHYPHVFDPSKVGSYPASAKAGGGYVWDEVLEYRVWCHGSKSDYYSSFASYEDALSFSQSTKGADNPIALVLQREFIDEPEPGVFVHVTQERIAEWPVSFLSRPRRNKHTIPNFLSPNAPANKMDIIRGLVK